MTRYAHPMPSHNIQFLSNTLAIFCFFILCLFGVAVGASELCSSKHSRPELGVVIENPRHSHRIFAENRWQCVSAVNKEISYSEFSSFERALAQCTSLNLVHQAPDKDNAQWEILSEEQQDLYCIAASDLTPHDVYVGHALIHLWPRGYGEYKFELGETRIHYAGLLNWKADDSFFWARLEYTPEFKSSRCSDAVCDAHATTGSQFAIPLIEPAYGTVDFSIPLLSAEFPGLLPLSLHYSS